MTISSKFRENPPTDGYHCATKKMQDEIERATVKAIKLLGGNIETYYKLGVRDNAPTDWLRARRIPPSHIFFVAEWLDGKVTAQELAPYLFPSEKDKKEITRYKGQTRQGDK